MLLNWEQVSKFAFDSDEFSTLFEDSCFTISKKVNDFSKVHELLLASYFICRFASVTCAHWFKLKLSTRRTLAGIGSLISLITLIEDGKRVDR